MGTTDVHGPERELELRLGNLLRAGVIIAAIVMLAGGSTYLVRHGLELPSYHAFRGEPPELRSIDGVQADCVQGHERGIMQLGLLLLIATPIARVALAAYGFARQRD